MVMNKDNLIRGNTVLAPQYEPFEKEYEKLSKYKKETNAINRQKRVQSKAKTIAFIILLFAVGFSVIYRYSVLYSAEKKLDAINSQVSALKMDNEDLNVKLLKFSNIKQLEDTAAKNNMVNPSKSSIIYCDLTKDNFSKASENSSEKVQQTLLNKIKNLLFLF